MPHFIGKTKKNNYDDENGNNLSLDDNGNKTVISVFLVCAVQAVGLPMVAGQIDG